MNGAAFPFVGVRATALKVAFSDGISLKKKSLLSEKRVCWAVILVNFCNPVAFARELDAAANPTFESEISFSFFKYFYAQYFVGLINNMRAIYLIANLPFSLLK